MKTKQNQDCVFFLSMSKTKLQKVHLKFTDEYSSSENNLALWKLCKSSYIYFPFVLFHLSANNNIIIISVLLICNSNYKINMKEHFEWNKMYH